MLEIRRPLYLPSLAALGMIALLAGGKYPYFFFYFFLFLVLLPLLWLSVALLKLSGEIEISAERIEVGGSVAVKYLVQNSILGRFPYLELSNLPGSSFSVPPEDKIVSLEAGERAVYERRVTCLRRGIFDIKEFRVKTGDPFGIFQVSKALASGKVIRVYPRPILPQGIVPAARRHFGDLNVSDNHFENQSLIADLRLFRRGDGIKRIHWKQTARQGRLVVKTFERKGDAAPRIFLDMSQAGYRRDRDHRLEDLAVETAASFVYYFLGNSVPVEIFAEPITGGRVGGSRPADLLRVMDEVIALSPRGEADFSSFVATYCYYLAPGGSLYLVSPVVTAETAAVIIALKQKGFDLFFYYISEAASGDVTRGILDKMNESGVRTRMLFVSAADQNETAAG